MNLEAALTAVAVTFPTPDRGELLEARVERLQGVSEAVVLAAGRATCSSPWDLIDEPCVRIWPGSRVSLAALVWSLGYLESGYAEWVHAGRCRLHIGECDARKERGVWVAGAVSPWQLQRVGYAARVWDVLEGTGEWSTFVAAWTATRTIVAGRKMCQYRRPELPWLTASISAYATGGHCDYPRAGKRAAFVVRVEGHLRSELAARAADDPKH
jgi:hypothetical protein